MKKGIIILFSEDEKTINKNQLINIFKQKDVKLCFVNNGSKDNTLQALEAVMGEADTHSISIIDIKKNTTTNAAVKAATRYIQNSEDIKCILYIKSNLLKYLEDKKKKIELLKIIETQFKQALYNHKSSKDLKKNFSYKELLSFQKIN